jgi:hypothetical protein
MNSMKKEFSNTGLLPMVASDDADGYHLGCLYCLRFLKSRLPSGIYLDCLLNLCAS